MRPSSSASKSGAVELSRRWVGARTSGRSAPGSVTLRLPVVGAAGMVDDLDEGEAVLVADAPVVDVVHERHREVDAETADPPLGERRRPVRLVDGTGIERHAVVG